MVSQLSLKGIPGATGAFIRGDHLSASLNYNVNVSNCRCSDMLFGIVTGRTVQHLEGAGDGCPAVSENHTFFCFFCELVTLFLGDRQTFTLLHYPSLRCLSLLNT